MNDSYGRELKPPPPPRFSFCKINVVIRFEAKCAESDLSNSRFRLVLKSAAKRRICHFARLFIQKYDIFRTMLEISNSNSAIHDSSIASCAAG